MSVYGRGGGAGGGGPLLMVLFYLVFGGKISTETLSCRIEIFIYSFFLSNVFYIFFYFLCSYQLITSNEFNKVK